MSDETPPVPAQEPSPDARKIARGGNPDWEETFSHPRHGELTFRAKLPQALALAQHSVVMDNLLADLEGEPRAATMILVSALAGMTDGLLMTLPVVDERRVEDEERGSVKIERVFYDPQAEPDVGFLVDVWTAYSAWRRAKLGEVDAVKGSFGETGGSASSALSNEPTVSPSTTSD